MTRKTDRRCFLARGIVGAAGIGAAASIEENILQAAIDGGEARPDAKAEPKPPQTDIAPGSLPKGKIGKVAISRLIMGGNLIGGWAHSRDLMYTARLFKAYNTEAKIFETLDLGVACGIDTIQIDPACWDSIVKYNRARETKIQTIVCVNPTADKAKMNETIKRQLDHGATCVYSHGGATDSHFRRGGSTDVLSQMVELIKAQGVPAGVGSHSLEVPRACEREKVGVDFYMKTFHMDRYWSATPKEHRKEYDWFDMDSSNHNANYDAMWCNNPEETAEFMETVEKPWLAFKVMAAGAIPPRMAFPYAFRNGADFIVAGMFDFQVESDAKIVIEKIKSFESRKRPWRG